MKKIDRGEDNPQQDRVYISDQVKKTLEERIKKIESGKATFKPWSEVQAKYKRRKL
jgi:3-phenylpropionate/cinnamic acid dioxygenase small subunit